MRTGPKPKEDQLDLTNELINELEEDGVFRFEFLKILATIAKNLEHIIDLLQKQEWRELGYKP